MDPTQLSDTIDTIAAEPLEATIDGQTAKNHPLPDLIALETHQASKAALAGSNRRGGRKSAWKKVMTGIANPPGSVRPC